MEGLNKLSELKPDGFRRDLVLMRRENFTYLGIEEGSQTCLVLAWSKETNQTDRHMLTVRALQRLVGSKQVPNYRIAPDPSRNFGFILCPDEDKAEKLRGHYVRVGDEKIFFDIVSSVGYMPYLDDVNQHPRVSKMI
ncbi:hypothetical protein PVAP13_1NG275800 [Panicum virgatum]|uniref:Uncharacterized protein n=1 Tax=Panicum virgatum TaxID=38727 RepID=A0A8T0WSV8_PANVG|nr:hypothetical protein PVAP13_1NG275800 [Panicum virgatum]